MFSVERIVALLTPVFAAVSAWLTGWVATHFPGLPHIPAADLTALQIAGLIAALSAALKWLHGRQKFVSDITSVENAVKNAVGTVLSDVHAGPAIEDIAQLLKSHTDQIITELGKVVHAPAEIEAIVRQVIDQIVTPAPNFPKE